MFHHAQTAKLADFGLARKINSEKTKLTAGLGTLDYMAPEAKDNEPVAFKSDMYSLGLVLHFMMTRTLPSLKKNVRTGIYNIPSVYSKDLVDLMKHLLQEEPEKRPPSLFSILNSQYLLMAIEQIYVCDCSKNASDGDEVEVLRRRVRELESEIKSMQ